jgi:hypothetical protein
VIGWHISIAPNSLSPSLKTVNESAEPTRVLLIGSRDGIRETIDHLCTLNFCDHAEWSKIQPHPDRLGDFLSTMTKWRI